MGERRYNILLLAYDKEDCPICLESFNFGDVVRFGDPCRHKFHESCFMKLQDYHKCPMCRCTYKRTYTLVIPPKPEEEDAYPPPSPPYVSPPQTPSPPASPPIAPPPLPSVCPSCTRHLSNVGATSVLSRCLHLYHTHCVARVMEEGRCLYNGCDSIVTSAVDFAFQFLL